MAINSGDVQNAYALPLGGVQAALAQNQEYIARQQQIAYERQRQAQAQQMKTLDWLNDAVSPLQGGTGTPIDAAINKQLSEGINGFTQYARTQPDPIAQMQYIQKLTGGIKSQQDNAKLLAKRVDEATKMAEKEYPYLDANAVKSYFMQNAFYDRDEKGNPIVRANLNPSIDFFGNFSDPNVAVERGLINQAAIDRGAREAIPKLYPNVSLPAVNGRQDVRSGIWEAQAPAYRTIDPATGQTYIQRAPIMIPTDNGQVQVNGSPQAIAATIQQDPTLRFAMMNEVSSLKKQYPKATDEQLAQTATYNLLNKYGSGFGDQQAKFNDAEWKAAHQLQREATLDARAARTEARMARGEQRAIARDARTAAKDAKESQPNPYQLGKAYWDNSVAADSPEGQYLGQFVQAAGNTVGLDLNGLAQKPVLKHPVTKQDISVQLGKTQNGQPLLQVITKGKKDAPPQLKVYQGKDAVRFYNSIANQLQFEKKTQPINYEEAILNAGALNNLATEYQGD